MPTTVVHLKRCEYDVVIDRRTKWGNPFRIGVDGDRQQVVEKYEAYILTRPDLLKSLHELRGKKLGCWCHPLACHGNVLARLADAST
jgi:hypothetical protein